MFKDIPPASFLSYKYHDRSLDADKMYLSSGLNAMLVTVKVCPDRGSPTGCHLSVSYTRTTACSADVALHAVAASFLLVETASVID